MLLLITHPTNGNLANKVPMVIHPIINRAKILVMVLINKEALVEVTNNNNIIKFSNIKESMLLPPTHLTLNLLYHIKIVNNNVLLHILISTRRANISSSNNNSEPLIQRSINNLNSNNELIIQYCINNLKVNKVTAIHKGSPIMGNTNTTKGINRL